MARLHHDLVTEPDGADRWVFFLHGIYGAGRNWATVARRVVRERTDWGAALIDLREHGASRGAEPPHTLESVAGDLRELAEGEALAPAALIGHSFGGKVALVYARRPTMRLRQLWVVDSTPDPGRPSGTAWQMLQVLRRLPATFGGRAEAVQALEAEGIATPVAQWMTTNLQRQDGGLYGWRIDMAAMEALLRDFHRIDAWDVVEDPPPSVEIHFVKAEGSDVLSPEACRRVEDAGRRTGSVFLHRVEGGHWLNADNPDALVDLLTARLPADGGPGDEAGRP